MTEKDDVVPGKIKVEPSAGLISLAFTMAQFHEALTRAGFNEQQARGYVSSVYSSMMAEHVKGSTNDL